MDDGLSHVSVGGHKHKIGQWGIKSFGMDPTMVCRGYNGPSSKYHSVTQ